MPEALHYQIDEYYLDLQKRAQDMEIMDEQDTQRNPFPGLRPFRTAEAHLFFGREGQSEELIQRLMQTHFLGVLGNSGSGKSSLVRAGLIPALHAGKKQQRVSDWKIVICRPGNSPVQNLAAAMAGANKNTTEPSVLVPEVERLLPLLKDSSFGLLEAEDGAGTHDKTLLIVDQFEELFRFGRDIPPGEAAHFVDLLLTAVQQEGTHLYVVITMRSEFLGECVRYRGLPEIINSGQYLVPRLTGENVRRAVAGPLGVVGAPVDATLVNRLVREVGDNMDQLPLLQHALMRTYRHWQLQEGEGPISHVDYEATGEMAHALGRHADEHYQALDAKGQQIARLIFQRLTDLSAGDKGGRRPTLLAEIYGLAEAIPATRKEVDAVIEQFRHLDTSFLMPPPGAPLQDEHILDISHESLIRNWARLHDWAKDEAENARLYQRLQQACAENTEDPAQGWISGALLQRLREWRAEAPVNAYWAARYHPDELPTHDWESHRRLFDDNMAFLQQCEDREQEETNRREAEIAEKARGKQRARYRNVIIAITTGAAVIAIVFSFYTKKTLDALTKSDAIVVRLTLAEVDRLVYKLDYSAAQDTLRTILSLDVSKKEMSDALLEFAFWYAETGDSARAWEVLDTAYQLVGRRLDPVSDKTRDGVRTALYTLSPARDSFLQVRYYPEMVWVEGDTFTMGCDTNRGDQDCQDDELPPHPVTLSDFRIARTETTVWQFYLYCENEGIDIRDYAPGWGLSGDNPIVNVTWYDAAKYANWMSSRQAGLQKAYTFDEEGEFEKVNDEAGPAYRLPTEAQWEFAARGGKKDVPSLFAGSNELDEVGWSDENSILDGVGQTHPAGTKKANELGLYDMSGNVWEWCEDWYSSSYYDKCKEKGIQQGPKGPKEDESDYGSRVLRGGSWYYDYRLCRVSYRSRSDPRFRYDILGFRLTQD